MKLIKMFNRTYSNERSVQVTGMVFCVVVACFITYLSGKFGCDGVIFVGVIVKNIMLVKIAGHAHTHYPVTLISSVGLFAIH